MPFSASPRAVPIPKNRREFEFSNEAVQSVISAKPSNVALVALEAHGIASRVHGVLDRRAALRGSAFNRASFQSVPRLRSHRRAFKRSGDSGELRCDACQHAGHVRSGLADLATCRQSQFAVVVGPTRPQLFQHRRSMFAHGCWTMFVAASHGGRIMATYKTVPLVDYDVAFRDATAAGRR